MENPSHPADFMRYMMANRLFFRLYQCTNMLHKTGSRAVEAEGLTTQQWAVGGAVTTQGRQGDEHRRAGALSDAQPPESGWRRGQDGARWPSHQCA